MRTLLLALMIVLLPIRGWLGDAMAVEMARHAMPAVAMVAAKTAISKATGAHCHEAMNAGDDMAGMSAPMGSVDAVDMAANENAAAHEGHDADGNPHDAATGHQGCGTCTVCQVCHTVALGAMPGATIMHAAPQAAPAFQPARFASAEPVPGLKPPIS